MDEMQKHMSEKMMVPKTSKEWRQAYALYMDIHGKMPIRGKELKEAKTLFMVAVKKGNIELNFEERSFDRRFGLSGLIRGRA